MAENLRCVRAAVFALSIGNYNIYGVLGVKKVLGHRSPVRRSYYGINPGTQLEAATYVLSRLTNIL